jgi:hypothetical protein
MVLLAMGVMIAGSSGIAQQEQQNPEQMSPQTGSPTGSMMPGGMMPGGMAMCGQMMPGGMTCPHQAITSLTAKIVTSFKDIEGEQNPELLKTKLAELGTLVGELQTKSEEKCPMMEKMGEPMMMGPMMGGESKSQ